MVQRPSVSITASGVTQADIDAQRADVEEAVRHLRYMPVLGLGLTYSF